ncbi:hypothetical protein L2E82_33302 [Cichorium intybus]|uniref:Uncharacterized protein n=1 Tax=Cichorium intybus TaxID=13427 RepID=A0ACB9BJS0_CICIN|nr:hypothetical protein L2E82_33302 [Cichorium intybus]
MGIITFAINPDDIRGITIFGFLELHLCFLVSAMTQILPFESDTQNFVTSEGSQPLKQVKVCKREEAASTMQLDLCPILCPSSGSDFLISAQTEINWGREKDQKVLEHCMSLANCSKFISRSVIRSIETARIFDFEEFPVRDKVTYMYYTGRLEVLNENFPSVGTFSVELPHQLMLDKGCKVFQLRQVGQLTYDRSENVIEEIEKQPSTIPDQEFCIKVDPQDIAMLAVS